MKNEHTPQAQRQTLELPTGAPLVRITAGAGSPGQKTWNLRRPVTLIGSRRPASIVLHDQDISNAHCVIVNTGSEVLLKDLHTRSGTTCNKERIDLTLLKDGDVVVVGETSIQVAIQVDRNQADDSGCGVEFVDPKKFPEPVTLYLAHTDRTWRIEDAAVLIGRHAEAAVRIDHEAVSTRHALLFRFGGEPAIFDLGSRVGVTVNGEECSLAPVSHGDRLAVGPCVLGIGSQDPSATACVSPVSRDTKVAKPTTSPDSSGGVDVGPAGVCQSGEVAGSSGAFSSLGDPSPVGSCPTVEMLDLDADPERALSTIESRLGKLQTNLAESWERLNSWESQLTHNATTLSKQHSDLSTREAELEAKDAALRGQLHDLTRYHEEIAGRERELTRQLARIQARQDQLKRAQTLFLEKQTTITRRAEELQRREHVLAQRWTRLLSARCLHCGKPVNLG